MHMKEIQKFVQYKLHYLDKRSNNVAYDTTTFFIAYEKPFNTVHEDTISGWVKCVMAEVVIDVSKYITHSCRSAASTGALWKGVHIEDISKQGNWSNLKTFKKNFILKILKVWTNL